MARDGESMYEKLVDRCRSLETSQAKLREEFDEIAKKDEDDGDETAATATATAYEEVESVEGCWIPGYFAAGTPYRGVLENMGHALHVCLASSGEIVYWNCAAELLYGWKDYEVLGQNGSELLIAEEFYTPLNRIMGRLRSGKSWSGQFPMRKRSGEMFMVLVTKSPLYEGGELYGVITVSSDAAVFNSINSETLRPSQNRTKGPNLKSIQGHPPRPQITYVPQIASSVSNLASKLFSRRQGDDTCASSGDGEDTEVVEDTKFEKPVTLAARVLAKLNVTRIGNSEKEDEENGTDVTSPIDEMVDNRNFRAGSSSYSICKDRRESGVGCFSRECRECFGLPRPTKLMSIYECQGGANLMVQDVSNAEVLEIEEEEEEQRELGGKRFSSFGENGSQESSSSKDEPFATADCEIQWEDLKLGEEVGQGCFAVVYRGLWKGTDVAVKVYLEKAYNEVILEDYKKEISIMKKLRHPNVLLFMGAVYSEERLAIVTEFLPRGSLFKTLHKNNQALDIRKRMRMALDVARGMNYLHHRNPPIVHRDLKTSNLLVDKNWTVKVGDFGLSKLKNGTFITAKSGRGTPQWMAPEILRNEPSNEKADVFSFGVILWELVTVSVPWSNLNTLQVVGVVGFMDRRLDIPEGIDPQISSIIQDCWRSDPAQRPSFEDLIQRMGGLAQKTSTTSVHRSSTIT